MADVELVMESADLLSRMSNQVAEGKKIEDGFDTTTENKRRYHEWDDYNVALLEAAFKNHGGWLTTTPISEYRRISFPVADLSLNRTAGIAADRVGQIRDSIAEKCRYMESLGRRLDLYMPSAPAAGATSDRAAVAPDTGAIFLVHGHDHLLRESVRRFLEGVTQRQVIVLDEQPNSGRDILGKLLDKAYEAAFAVVLLTGDDEGYLAGSAAAAKPRARQNVILELGLFLGLLGRAKVAALYQDGVEIPSDYHGVVYTKVDEGGWQLRLARELKAAGIDVDMNSLV